MHDWAGNANREIRGATFWCGGKHGEINVEEKAGEEGRGRRRRE
jgi:hypothetical protein